MPFDAPLAARYLQDFKLRELFIDALDWHNPPQAEARLQAEELDGLAYRVQTVAQLAGARIYRVLPGLALGQPFDGKQRRAIAAHLADRAAGNVTIFQDREESGEHKPQSWHWLWQKRVKGKYEVREHPYHRGQPAEFFINKIRALHVDMAEQDEGILAVAAKLRRALDVEAVTKKFFRAYQDTFEHILPYIHGIDNPEDKRWYASVLLNRLMFIYFLQAKGFVDKGNRSYLSDKLRQVQREQGREHYFSYFLRQLFFEGFAKPEADRSAETNRLLCTIRYLNGGLFLPHKFENPARYPDLRVEDAAFELLLAEDSDPKGLFTRFSWTLNEVPERPEDEINPDILGHIFEKYINQKEFGAYYTRPEITEYLCKQTVDKLIIDGLSESPDLALISDRGKPLEPRRYESIGEVYERMDAAMVKKLILHGGRNESLGILQGLSLLDPACGSGAFLVAAMKVLIGTYSSVYGRIDFINDAALNKHKAQILAEHPSLDYYIKKQIITHNLFGVDVMEEATEIAKLRLFLALVSSARTVDELEPLPNIDFNIMCGNSLIGLLGVEAEGFDNRNKKSPLLKGEGVGAGAATVPTQTHLFKQVAVQTTFLTHNGVANYNGDHTYGWKNYETLVREKERLIDTYRRTPGGPEVLQPLKANIEAAKAEARSVLDKMLLAKMDELGIRYEQQTWDEAKGKEGKPLKRFLTEADVAALCPFHWGYEFSEVFRRSGGFDAIITNPPWEVFQTDEKEWFSKLDDKIQKKKLRIEDWKKQFGAFMADADIRKSWLDYATASPTRAPGIKRARTIWACWAASSISMASLRCGATSFCGLKGIVVR